MRQADAFHISHPIAKIYPEILRHTLRLAKLAGKEQDALRRRLWQSRRRAGVSSHFWTAWEVLIVFVVIGWLGGHGNPWPPNPYRGPCSWSWRG